LQLLNEDDGPDLDNEGAGGGNESHSSSPELQPTPDLEIKEEKKVPANKKPMLKSTVRFNLMETN
jgi:hypothetical protein